MSHDCRSNLCDTPHSELDSHADECGCSDCHEFREHSWADWGIYPECDGCLRELAQWIHENTDFVGCPIPEYCDYSPACDEQYQIEVYGKIVRPRKKVAHA